MWEELFVLIWPPRFPFRWRSRNQDAFWTSDFKLESRFQNEATRFQFGIWLPHFGVLISNVEFQNPIWNLDSKMRRRDSNLESGFGVLVSKLQIQIPNWNLGASFWNLDSKLDSGMGLSKSRLQIEVPWDFF